MKFKLINKNEIVFEKMSITHNFKIRETDIVKYFMPTLSYNEENNFLFLKKSCSLKKLQPSYDWLNCYEPERHLDILVKDIIEAKLVRKNDYLCFLSFKDKSLSTRFKKKGFNKIKLIDAKKDLMILEKNFLIETIQHKFQLGHLNNINHKSKYKFLFARHIFEHVKNLNLFLKNAMYVLQNDGYLLLEIPDCTRAINTGDPTLYWEEHNYYFTPDSFKNFLKKRNFKLIYFKKFKDRLENCLVAIIQNKKEIYQNKKLLKKKNLLSSYFKCLKNNFKLTQKFFNIISKNSTIVIYGASHLTFTFIELMEIGKYIELVIDDDIHKNNLFAPVHNIKIMSFNDVKSKKIDYFLLGLNPNHHKKVSVKLKKVYPKSKILSIFPKTNNYYLDYRIKM